MARLCLTLLLIHPAAVSSRYSTLSRLCCSSTCCGDPGVVIHGNISYRDQFDWLMAANTGQLVYV